MLSPLDVFRPDVLAGKVALVTGGGSGICRGIAAAYARFGADVCIVGRKPDRLAETASEIRTVESEPRTALSDARTDVSDARTNLMRAVLGWPKPHKAPKAGDRS